MTVCCDNCEAWFCEDCDDDSAACVRCGREYCGSCVKQGETCGCQSDDDGE